MGEQLKQIAEDYLARIRHKLPKIKSRRLQIVGIIGLPGSGKSEVAKLLADNIEGMALLSGDSARYLLKEAGLGWGENIRQVLKYVAQKLLAEGFSVIFDGNTADAEGRNNIEELARASGTEIMYIRVNIDPELAKERQKNKYDDQKWVSSFENFRVNTTDKMLANIDERLKVHQELQSSEIQGLVAELDNNGSIGELRVKTMQIIQKLKEG